AAERARKGVLKWYISCVQFYPQPNYFIDAPAMDPVMVPWITWRYNLQGILYWDLKYWSQTVDPWLNSTTYLSGYLCSDGRNLNGEGSLLYPGSEVHRYTGQRDVDGPVSSIRFELLREGIEDYEYLWMLKSLGDLAVRIRRQCEIVKCHADVQLRYWVAVLCDLDRSRVDTSLRVARRNDIDPDGP